MKTCNRCGETKGMEGFYPHKGALDGHKNQCKVCILAAQKGKREHDPIDSRRRRLMARYGLTLEAYEAMRKEQGGRCKICGVHEESVLHNKLFVDHCHDTGKVRGLLCHHCNAAIGHMRDDVEVLAAAINYLNND